MTNDENNDSNTRIVPTNDLEAYMMNIEPNWGKNEIPSEFKDEFDQYFKIEGH